jgi:2,3-bisphosphoglycerate-independent phosphoglycerate mutase
LALLGYKPQEYYLGRGPYETAGIGMELKKGDVALRVNFATVSKDLKVIDRRAGRISKTESLIKALQGIEIQGIKFLIKKSYGHRAGLILRSLKPGLNLSAKISDGDPHKIGVKIKKIIATDKTPQAEFTAEVLNKYLEKTHRVLKEHPLNKKRGKRELLPANYLLVRGAGEMRKTPTFKEKHNLRACCIAGGGLYKGIGKILGMDLIKVKGATGLPTTNLKGKFLAARNALKKYDFIFLHIKATDNLAEDGNFQGKKKFIEKIDKDIKTLLKLKNTLMVITADHSTCCSIKRHCLEPVPILIFGGGRDRVQQFSEKACREGRLGRIKQMEVMKTLLNKADLPVPGSDKG